MSKTILVVGATGMLGEPVARRLKSDGHTVRVLTRREAHAREMFGNGFDIVPGDVEDTLAVAKALDGVDVVHVSLSGGADPWLEYRGAEAVASAAAKGGVGRITLLSGATVFAWNCWFEPTRAKYEAERAIEDSGVPFSIFKATWFMESLPRFVGRSSATVFGTQPHPIRFVAASDYATMVSKAIETDEAANKRFFVHGPEALTFASALSRYCAVASPGLRVVSRPFWLLSAVSRLPGRAAMREVLPFMRYCSTVKEGGDPTEANELLGKPETGLEVWASQRRSG